MLSAFPFVNSCEHETLDASEEGTQSSALRGSRKLQEPPRRPPPPPMLRAVSTLPTLRPLLWSPLLLSPKPLLFYRRPPRPFRAFSSSTPLAASPPSASWVGDNGEENLLRCAAAGRAPLRVAVLVSGGVDSSVALRLLHAAGHRCTAFYLKIWFQEDFRNFWSECPWDDDLKYAQAVCDKIDVSLEVVHLSDEYWKHVVSHIINEYRSGRTPNPDVLCNTRIKFGAFLEAIENLGFDYIASGHYAHVVRPSFESVEGPSVLQLSKDKVKDQTYLLSHLSQPQLKRLLFPLGCKTKDEVRRLAAQMDLPNQDRKDSHGICFLGKVKFSEFVERHIGEMAGILLEAETGDYLGTHRGFWFYTIGQRQGLHLPGGPWYALSLILVIGPATGPHGQANTKGPKESEGPEGGPKGAQGVTATRMPKDLRAGVPRILQVPQFRWTGRISLVNRDQEGPPMTEGYT